MTQTLHRHALLLPWLLLRLPLLLRVLLFYVRFWGLNIARMLGDRYEQWRPCCFLGNLSFHSNSMTVLPTAPATPNPHNIFENSNLLKPPHAAPAQPLGPACRFLKEQDVGFTAEPYVCAGRRVGPQEEVLLVVASDGLWDVVSQERVAALATKAAAAAGSGVVGREDEVAGGGQQEQQPQARSGRSVAAAVAEELMQSALRLHSKDDISIMVLHLLPEAVADARRQAGPGRHASSSGSM